MIAFDRSMPSIIRTTSLLSWMTVRQTIHRRSWRGSPGYESRTSLTSA